MDVVYKITKDKSLEIKGIAIILMIIHHFFTFPEYYINGCSTQIEIFSKYMREPTKICVAMFAFITGWALALNNNTWKRTIKK